MGASTPQEAAIAAANTPWNDLPATQARIHQVAGIARHARASFDADGMTLALQAHLALDAQNPLQQVIPWMRQEKMWPFVPGNK